MMKATINLLGITILFFLFVLGCSKNEAENEAYMVEIINKGIYDITDIELSMIGSEDVLTFQKIAAGKSSGYQTFILPKLEGDIPDSWGDYNGVYTQRGTVKEIFILNYEHKFRAKMRIEIDNNSYVVIYP